MDACHCPVSDAALCGWGWVSRGDRGDSSRASLLCGQWLMLIARLALLQVPGRPARQRSRRPGFNAPF